MLPGHLASTNSRASVHGTPFKDTSREDKLGVSRKGLGYDYQFTYASGKVEKVEVKGVRKPYGIPDMRVKEFQSKRLKADYLLVVGNAMSPGKERLYKIPNMEKYRVL